MRLINHPVLCNYYLTYRCNAKCGFCDIWEKPSPYVTLENVRENLLALKKMRVRIVDFTGGEPLLHRSLPDFLTLAKALGFITTVTTNTLLYPKFAEKLKGNIDMLHFSLDSADKDKHNASRGVECFDMLIESIRIAKGLGEKPDILFTVNEQNYSEIGDVYRRFVEEEGLMLILNPIFAYNGVGSDLGKAALAELEKWEGRRGIYLNHAFLELRKNGGNNTSDPVCKAASTTVVISPENELILPCYHLGTKSFPINGKLEDLYRQSEVKQLIRQEGRLPGCEGCVVNCYMEPSFATELNRYFLQSLGSTLKYSLEKWVYA